MTLRAGSYDASRPDWRGTILEDSWGIYRCLHLDHPDRAAAKACSRQALAYLKANGRLPVDWGLTRQALLHGYEMPARGGSQEEEREKESQ